ncbi:MAG: NfeD family protein [Alphaproteobacteria bacterium]|nr:NfeD family protein [Alphaproteobacteria bacterium]
MELFGFNLENLVFWHWWIVAGVFFLFEVLSLSFFFLWLGLAAVIVGLLILMLPAILWPLQFTLWAGLSVITAVLWRVYKKKNPDMHASDEPALNKRGQQYIGRTFTLTEPVVNGFGKVKVDDSIWKIEAAADIEAGQKVKVNAIEGTILKVEVEN